MLDTLDEIWMHFLRVSLVHHCNMGIMEIGKGQSLGLHVDFNALPCKLCLHPCQASPDKLRHVGAGGWQACGFWLLLGVQRGCRWLQCLVSKSLFGPLLICL